MFVNFLNIKPKFFTKSLCCSVLAILLLFPVIIFSQVSGGTISGRVVDSTDAVIPGAKLNIKNVNTGQTIQLVIDESGVYRATNLIPGSYEIEATATNFSPFLQKGINLTVGAELNIDLKLTAGGVEASVTISSSPTVDTLTPTLSAVVSEKTIVELPLNGRDWTTLATLQPGISSVRPQAPSGSTTARGNRGYGDELAISGHRPQENNYRVDGVSINDYSNGAPGSAGGVNLGADAIKEFSVLSSNYTAEYGRTSGGVINAITRSGTNSFRGSAYEFFRNDALDARNPFDIKGRPPLRRNQFGFSAGGPIIKNKTFIFGDYEAIRRRQGISTTSNVLSANARNGILSTGNVVVNDAIKPYLAFWALPNAGLNPSGDTGSYVAALTQVFDEDFFTFRLDHQFSPKDSIFGTYFYDVGTFTVPDPLNNTTFPNKTRRQMIAIEETHTFNQNFVNSFRVGFNRTEGDVNIEGEAINPIAADISLGSATGRPSAILQVAGLTSAVANGGNSFFEHVQNSYQIYDDAFYSLGNHSFRFGTAFEKIEYNELGLRRQNGLFAFGSIRNFLTNTPNSFFALDPSRKGRVGVRTNIFALYFNDSWRVSPKLNLNLGLRYEMSTKPTEHYDRFTAVQTLTSPITNVKSYFDSNPTLLNFEPRVGFAYDVFGDAKTAFRGGFGIYDALPLPWIFTPKAAQGTPFNVGTNVSGLAVGDFPKLAFSKINFAAVPGDSMLIERNPSRSYVMNWNLTMQHQIINNLTTTIAYVGSRGVHVARVTDDANIVLPTNLNDEYPVWTGTTKVNPRAGQLRTNTWDGNNSYHGLQVQLMRSLTSGVQAQASYTWSKCIDEGSGASRNDQFSNGITTPIFFNKTNQRGRCDYDLTHVFVGNALWLLPSPKDGLAKAFLGGWQLGGIVSASSGTPFTVVMSGDPLGLGGVDVVGFPNVVAGCKITTPNNGVNYLNAACFTPPNPIRKLGNIGRNSVTGPGLFNVDMALYKNIDVKAISEDFGIQLRLEVFNILNHTNFAAPLSNNAVFNQSGNPIPSFGQITSTQTTSRQIQLGLRIKW